MLLDEAERRQIPLTEALQEDYMQAKLRSNNETRLAQTAMPPGSKRSGGYTQHDVEYYIQNPDKRPEDHDLAVKVLNAKISQQKKESMFSDIMYTDNM